VQEDPRINATRVAGRVMAGGHTAPIEKITAARDQQEEREGSSQTHFLVAA